MEEGNKNSFWYKPRNIFSSLPSSFSLFVVSFLFFSSPRFSTLLSFSSFPSTSLVQYSEEYNQQEIGDDKNVTFCTSCVPKEYITARGNSNNNHCRQCHKQTNDTFFFLSLFSLSSCLSLSSLESRKMISIIYGFPHSFLSPFFSRLSPFFSRLSPSPFLSLLLSSLSLYNFVLFSIQFSLILFMHDEYSTR